MNVRSAGGLFLPRYPVRRAPPDDAEAIADLLRASAVAVGTQSLVTPAELRIEWDRSDRYVVLDEDAQRPLRQAEVL